MMQRNLSLRSLGLALTIGLGLSAGAIFAAAPALALDAHAEEAPAEPAGAVAEFSVGDTVLRAQMPCAEPTDGPPGPDGLQTALCIMGDRMFIFAASQSVPVNPGPMTSDFDAAYEEVRSSRDTDSIEEIEVDGRRTMRATRGEGAGFGTMQAVQFAPDGLAYVIAMSRPNADQALSEMEKQEMRDFVASLEVSQ